MKIAILAGGGGTRLFPLSRTSYPKQFLKLDGELSLLAATVKRFLNLVSPSDLLIVTNKAHLYHVQNELRMVDAEAAHILLEPVGRNTAPAIALAVNFCKNELACGDDEIMIVSPADHVIRDTKSFVASILDGERLAKEGYIATFGIKPTHPEIGFGYIHTGESLSIGFKVDSFKEKPELSAAEEYLKDGTYYWNSGLFAFSIGAISEEFAKYVPELSHFLTIPYEEALKNFAGQPSISIDYAVAERTTRIALIPFTSQWSDVGSWDAIYNLADKDDAGNAIMGDALAVDCKNSLLLSKNRMIAAIDLEDLLIVETDDVILAAQKGHAQKVKKVVDILQKQGRKEAAEHLTVYRPWGAYTILGTGPEYKLKKILVKPGASLSLQMHYHRSEHWVVIEGTALVVIGEETKYVHTGESIFIPPSTKHRLENPGKLPLRIIEVQNGAYLEEDDIVRFDDIYGRE